MKFRVNLKTEVNIEFHEIEKTKRNYRVGEKTGHPSMSELSESIAKDMASSECGVAYSDKHNGFILHPEDFGIFVCKLGAYDPAIWTSDELTTKRAGKITIEFLSEDEVETVTTGSEG